MANIIASPTRYIQGKGELQNLRQHVEMLGKKLFILTTASGRHALHPRSMQALQAPTAPRFMSPSTANAAKVKLTVWWPIFRRPAVI